MNKIILGHNPIFGINHHSQKIGMEKSLEYKNPEQIISFLSIANNFGYDRMMLSTHPNAIKFLDSARVCDLKDKIIFYPLLPYMQKYVKKSNEAGIFPMINELMMSSGTLKGTKLIAKAGISGLLNKIDTLIKIAIEIEFNNFRGLKCDRVFLHNAITDLAIGLDMDLPIKYFLDFVKNNLGLKAGFGTLNLNAAVNKFNSWGLPNQYFMAPFNKNGHQMNPGLNDNIEILKKNPGIKLLAMSTLASGTIKPNEAFSFLRTIDNIESIVVGISNKKHLASTIECFSST